MTEHDSLCKLCKHRFRRVFMPEATAEFYDESGQKTMTSDEDVLIIQVCLISSIDVKGENTIECNHFCPKDDDDENKLNIFKHLK